MYLSIAFIHNEYLFFIGEDKPWYCISKCDSTFDKFSSAIPYFGFGFFLLWRTIREYFISFNNKQEKLKKRETYCCKCYEDGVLSKLKKLNGKYLCIHCDYATFYANSHDFKNVDLMKIENSIYTLKNKA